MPAVAKYHGPKSVSKSAGAASLVTDGRAMHQGDYRRAAALVKGMRRDQKGHLKNAQQQERIDALALAMAAVFEADSHEFGIPFGVAYFLAGTK
jgi:hypothetical protein